MASILEQKQQLDSLRKKIIEYTLGVKGINQWKESTILVIILPPTRQDCGPDFS